MIIIMLKIGNDNVAIGLRDVEYTYNNNTVTFSFEKGIYFFTVALSNGGDMHAYTYLFDSAIFEKMSIPSAANIGSSLSGDGELIAMRVVEGNMIAIVVNTGSGMTSKDNVVSFKYIPKE